jgi:hypothetical protein
MQQAAKHKNKQMRSKIHGAHLFDTEDNLAVLGPLHGKAENKTKPDDILRDENEAGRVIRD